jgi:putative transposase
MSRSNRIQYAGALYHVTSRGNRRANIFVDDRDHLIWCDLMAKTVDRFGVIVHSFCHMPNHYHLLVETPAANLSASIHHLNSNYAQTFNKRHRLTGHVLQGRFHAELLEHHAHLLALTRYIVLNPVRAQLVAEPEHWRWSSYTSTCGLTHPLPWISEEWLLSQFSGANRSERVDAYRRFVALGKEQGKTIKGHVAGRPLTHYSDQHPDRDAAVAEAYKSGAYSVDEIADYFKISCKTVRRAIKKWT